MIQIIGAGLAGCEAALQIASYGIEVHLYDMKPDYKSPAHHMDALGELVCSNSLRAARVENAVGLLKHELRFLGGDLIRLADQTAVPAGGALAVDRDDFAQAITERIQTNPLIRFESKLFSEIDLSVPTIIATGPLTQGNLFSWIQELLGQNQLHFFDAAAPIIMKDSLNFDIVFAQSRYGRGGDDYLNCPLNREEYLRFYQELIRAERAEVKDFDREIVFEGCMPIETMAGRGEDTMRFGPLKPVGLIDPRTGEMPYACVQLRQDDRQGNMYNLVGFQTRLKQGEQKRVFGLIPGLEKAEFLRYGVMHRNTYIQSPGKLKPTYEMIARENVYFAGQITGVEGYVESIASGFVAGTNAALKYLGKEELVFPPTSVIGSMAAYISDPQVKKFQPMNANFGLLPDFGYKVKKKDRPFEMVKRAKKDLQTIGERIQALKQVKSWPDHEIPLPEIKEKYEKK